MAKKKKKHAAKKASPAKKKKAKKKVASRKTSSSSKAKKSGSTSVDSLLKKFASERTRKESLLSSLRKKMTECEEKLRKQQEQIAKMVVDEKALETELAHLDKQRDTEVKELLEKLGVQLGGAAQPTASHQAPHSRDRHQPNNRVTSDRPQVTTSATNGRDDSK